MNNPYLGRIVVLISPLIAGLSVAIVNWVQTAVNVNLDGTQLTALLTAAAVGAFGVVFKWLDNRGQAERQAVAIKADPKLDNAAIE